MCCGHFGNDGHFNGVPIGYKNNVGCKSFLILHIIKYIPTKYHVSTKKRTILNLTAAL